MTSFRTLRIDVSHRVATIWLNRPERRNAFSSVMTRELYEAFALFESAEDVRAIVVTGTGRYFSAGADLERGGQTFNRPADAAPAATDPAGRIEPVLMRTPVIAAMNGSAVGMGLTLPLGWDIRFAAADAKYGFVFTRRGIGLPLDGAAGRRGGGRDRVPGKARAAMAAVQGQGLSADAVRIARGPA